MTMRKLLTAIAVTAALSGCGPSLWTLQDQCQQGDQGACVVAQQRLQMLNMSFGGLTASGNILNQSTTFVPARAPVTCNTFGNTTSCY